MSAQVTSNNNTYYTVGNTTPVTSTTGSYTVNLHHHPDYIQWAKSVVKDTWECDTTINNIYRWADGTTVYYRPTKTVDGYKTYLTLQNLHRTDSTSTNSIYMEGWAYPPGEREVDYIVQRRRNRLREVIRNRSFPGIHIKPSRTPLFAECDGRELRARETLRRVIGEERWCRFIKNGFISIRGKSGKFYQIFPGHGFTRVYENGVLVNRLCVVLRGNFPDTDSLITRFLMILNDEDDFWQRAVKHGTGAPRVHATGDGRALIVPGDKPIDLTPMRKTIITPIEVGDDLVAIARRTA
jgi:hypothetical protein